MITLQVIPFLHLRANTVLSLKMLLKKDLYILHDEQIIEKSMTHQSYFSITND